MGFFSSSQKTTSTYDNPELRQYTELYRGVSPWGFASLDPTATLAAMGEGETVGGKKLGGEFKGYLKGLSDQEKEEAQASQEALTRIRERQESGQFLTTQETEFINTQLDKAFEYAHKVGFADWERGAQSLAGGRGLRTSDTPVAAPAMRELRNLELGLSSERARMGLGATLDFSRNQQEFDLNFTNMLKNLQTNRWATRQGFLFGAGGQMAGNLGFTSTQTQKGSPSTFSKIMSGFQLANTALDFGKNVGGMIMGVPTPPKAPGGGGWGGMMGMQSNPY